MNPSLQHVLCAICTEVFFEPVLLPNCPHTFCRGCLERLQKQECPLCRSVCPPVAKLHKNIILDSVIQQQFPQEWAARKASESSTVDDWAKHKQEKGFAAMQVRSHPDMVEKVVRDILRELDRADIWTNIETEFEARSKLLSGRWITIYTREGAVSYPSDTLYVNIQWQNGGIYVVPLLPAPSVVATNQEIRWNSPLDVPSPPRDVLTLSSVKAMLLDESWAVDVRLVNALDILEHVEGSLAKRAVMLALSDEHVSQHMRLSNALEVLNISGVS